MLKVCIDGSIGPSNPGKIASYGFVVQRDDKNIAKNRGLVAKSDENVYTNNVAEYGALIAFFKWYWMAYENDILVKDGCINIGKADEQWIEAALIHSDSNLLVQQMNGEWQARDGVYYPYYEEAKELYSDRLHEFVGIEWISRNDNTLADELSKYSHYV